MGWKTSMIFVNSDKEYNQEELFASLGYYQLERVDEQYFESIINPDDDRIYIGKFNGNTIICMQDMPLESLDEDMSRGEQALSIAFENSDVVTLILHSVVNLWGYSIVENGKKVRVRAGSAEGGTIVEYGEPLKEEEDLLAQSRINEDGERVFILDDMPNDEFSDDQVGENFVFNISAKYFGESLDSSDGIFETKFTGYSFSRKKPRIKDLTPEVKVEKTHSKDIKPAESKPWWKFW